MSVWHLETGHVDSQERMSALDAQVKQLGLQAARDCERIAKDRTLMLQLLHKVSLSLLIHRLNCPICRMHEFRNDGSDDGVHAGSAF